MNRIALLCMLLMLMPISASAQHKADPKVGAGLPTNNHAVALALADASLLDPADRFYTRYLWIQNADLELAQALSHAINTCSRTNLIRRPFAIGKEKLLLLRIDVRHYAVRSNDLADWLNTWEELRFDPEFSLLLTKDSLRFIFGTDFSRPYVEDGKVMMEQVTRKTLNDQQHSVLRVVPPDLDERLWLELANAVVSTAPIVRADYFVARSLASIRDTKLFDGLYDLLYGGLYVRFKGIPDKSKEGTDLDNLLEQLGIGNVKQKVNKDTIFDRLRSDRRTAQFRSKVAAGRPRSVEFIPHLASSVYDGERFVSITSDLKRANLDIGVHPLLNLFKTLRNPDAHETIFDTGNGLHGYALHNGDGKLQEKVPDDVAKDHTVPSPYYGELQFPISCMACHEAEGSGGWKPVVNDAQKLLAKRPGAIRLDIPFDLNFADQIDGIDRIATLFSGDPKGMLEKGRNGYAAAVLRATGPWKEDVKNANKNVVKLSSTKLVDTWRGYFYDDIDAHKALLEIGWDVPTKDAANVLDKMTPPPRLGIGVLEDPRIAALKADIAISRFDFDLIRRTLAARVAATIKDNPKLLEDKK